MYFLLMGFFLFMSSMLFFVLLGLRKYFCFGKIKKIVLFLASIVFTIFYFESFFYFRLHNFEIIRILYYYIGILTYSFIVVFFIEFFRLVFIKILKLNYLEKILKYIFLISVFALMIISIYNHQNISIENYKIYTDKIDRDYKIIQISDIQYGTNTKAYLDKVMNLAIKQNPDFIVYTGDLIDFELYKLEDFDIFNKVKVPVYFERGNHEFYHFPEKILSYLKTFSSVYVLDNKKASFNDYIDIVGMDYDTRIVDKFEQELDNIDIDKNKFNIQLYHAPLHVKYSAKKGFDLQLYGHTHGGQFFPYTLIVDMIFEYSDGFYDLGKTKAYTTDGAGLWGPRMRLGSQNEIVVFDILKK